MKRKPVIPYPKIGRAVQAASASLKLSRRSEVEGSKPPCPNLTVGCPTCVLKVYCTRSLTTFGAKYGISRSPMITDGTNRARLGDTDTSRRVAGINARYDARESVYAKGTSISSTSPT